MVNKRKSPRGKRNLRCAERVVYCQKLDKRPLLRRIEVSRAPGHVVFFAQIYRQVNQLTG